MIIDKISASIGGVIIAFISLGGWAAFNWKESMDLTRKISDFEQQKVVQERLLMQKELSLEKTKLELDSLKKQLDTQRGNQEVTEGELKKGVDALKDRENVLITAAQQVSGNALAAKELSELNALATSISQLGVNLSDAPPCEEGALRRYNQGRTALRQLSSRAKASGLYSKFEAFINANSRMMVISGEGCR
jgi:hypothetical protein